MTTINTYILELTNKCNEHCSFCYSLSYSPDGTSKVGQLSTEEWKQGIDRIVEAGGKAIDFSGGEPTLHKGFGEILAYAKQRGLETIVSTNGSTYKHEPTREALGNYADCISYSLHGQDAETHDTVKGREGSYATAIKSIQHCADKTNVKVNTVACQQNLYGITGIGEAIDIENSNLVWKVSKALLQRAGAKNKATVEITDEEFNALEETLKERYPKAYSQNRLLFRRPAEKFEPYIVVRSDGSARIPHGEDSVPTGLYITEENLGTKLQGAVQSITGDPEAFANKLLANHDESYTLPRRSELVQLKIAG